MVQYKTPLVVVVMMMMIGLAQYAALQLCCGWLGWGKHASQQWTDCRNTEVTFVTASSDVHR